MRDLMFKLMRTMLHLTLLGGLYAQFRRFGGGGTDYDQ